MICIIPVVETFLPHMIASGSEIGFYLRSFIGDFLGIFVGALLSESLGYMYGAVDVT